jgi:hypothetical protein
MEEDCIGNQGPQWTVVLEEEEEEEDRKRGKKTKCVFTFI